MHRFILRTALGMALALGIVAAVQAQSRPTVHAVTDVESDDVLNIRSEPSARSEILGSYFPYAIAIEVLETTPDGRWGMVGLGEGNGWVSMRYLTDWPTPADEIPRPLRCFGTEPFWDLSMYPRGSEYTELGRERRDLNILSEDVTPTGFLARFEEGPTLNRVLEVAAGYCGDGMSDRRFGWSAVMSTQAPDGDYTDTGCCTLDGNN